MAFVKALKFGQYKDVPIEDVPTDYLEWIRDSQLSTIVTVFLELKRREREDRRETQDHMTPEERYTKQPQQTTFNDDDIPF